MGDKHVVRFEPVGIEIEVGEEQTILRAAFEQGVMLMHGCKEGQCSSCKSFVLDGDDIELDRYSTFALPDFEKEEGYTLLCRAHAYEDLTIELLNYDEDMIRSGLPITEAVAEVVSNDPVTHDMRHLVLKLVEPADVKFFPGQYMDIEVLAAITGGAVYSRQSGFTLETMTLDQLGRARQVRATAERTTIIDGGGSAADVEFRLGQLRARRSWRPSRTWTRATSPPTSPPAPSSVTRWPGWSCWPT
jgi:ferredoxin